MLLTTTKEGEGGCFLGGRARAEIRDFFCPLLSFPGKKKSSENQLSSSEKHGEAKAGALMCVSYKRRRENEYGPKLYK